MSKGLRICALLAGCLFASLVLAAGDPCASYKWDVTHEVALFRGNPTPLAAGVSADRAPDIQGERLYQVALQAQQDVHFTVQPSKPMLADGASAGILKLRVGEAGQHRIAIDSGFWLDIIADGKALASVDFNGSRECAGPRKIVVYDLPANTDLLLQLSHSDTARARITITRVRATAH